MSIHARRILSLELTQLTPVDWNVITMCFSVFHLNVLREVVFVLGLEITLHAIEDRSVVPLPDMFVQVELKLGLVLAQRTRVDGDVIIVRFSVLHLDVLHEILFTLGLELTLHTLEDIVIVPPPDVSVQAGLVLGLVLAKVTPVDWNVIMVGFSVLHLNVLREVLFVLGLEITMHATEERITVLLADVFVQVRPVLGLVLAQLALVEDRNVLTVSFSVSYLYVAHEVFFAFGLEFTLGTTEDRSCLFMLMQEMSVQMLLILGLVFTLLTPVDHKVLTVI